MNDNPDETPAPTPEAFVRPRAPRPGLPDDVHDAPVTTRAGADSGATTTRFPGTGDSQVDRAVAGLPDPQIHRRAAGGPRNSEGTEHYPADAELTDPGDGESTSVQGSLPDPALLDEHIGDVTAVHRLLQQRLSDLSG